MVLEVEVERVEDVLVDFVVEVLLEIVVLVD